MQEEAGGLGPTQGDLSAHHSVNLPFYSPGLPAAPVPRLDSLGAWKGSRE